VDVARRGWLGPENVFNTRSLKEVIDGFRAIKKRKAQA